jgi:hypothetical protein
LVFNDLGHDDYLAIVSKIVNEAGGRTVGGLMGGDGLVAVGERWMNSGADGSKGIDICVGQARVAG